VAFPVEIPAAVVVEARTWPELLQTQHVRVAVVVGGTALLLVLLLAVRVVAVGDLMVIAVVLEIRVLLLIQQLTIA
jgi:hypothetical protein